MDAFADAGLVGEPAAPVELLNGDAPAEPATNRLRDWEQEHEKLLQESENKELEAKKTRRESANAALQDWHEEEDGKLSKKKELNRTTEQQFVKFQEEKNTGGKPWDRVTSLIESVQAPAETDTTRMRKLLFSLKANPVTKA
jgi:hypothetical protein